MDFSHPVWSALVPTLTIIVWEILRPRFKIAWVWLVQLARLVASIWRRKVTRPVGFWWVKRQHGKRIAELEILQYDQYLLLSETDQRLFQTLRGRELGHLSRSMLREKMDEMERSMAPLRAKIDQALSEYGIPADGHPLQCYNCAFFGVSFKDVGHDLERDPFSGYCYRQRPVEDTYPEGFCGHHSALDGFVMSRRGIYNIAPLE